MGNSESTLITQALLKRGIIISSNLFKTKEGKLPDSERFQFKSAPKVTQKLGITFATAVPNNKKGSSADTAEEDDDKKYASSNFWRKMTLLLTLPALGGLAAYVYQSISEQEHERPPFIRYDYLRLRHKRFPWGEGNKTLFHNPKVNALPDGYEDEETPET